MITKVERDMSNRRMVLVRRASDGILMNITEAMFKKYQNFYILDDSDKKKYAASKPKGTRKVTRAAKATKED